MADELVVRIEDLARIEVRPGDRFVYRPPADRHIDAQTAGRILGRWAAHFPDNPLSIMPAGDLFAVRDEREVRVEVDNSPENIVARYLKDNQRRRLHNEL